ncbi:hypothetical protein GCM10010371_68940 [Streptomyces subrutilus]|uniref:histidine kinase n=1 Tax=Streptomyces subrutilus TaxID=36818 RepID=A0A918RH47_9ACTN|nr:MMPL family transporter [Streptomyces subrutilus]GGZ99855.1 hypothetical protein GCM10010371_68940 [Streptomyces subrutilus]
MKRAIAQAEASGLTVETGGSALSTGGGPGGTAEVIVVSIAVVLLITFGSLAAAGLPLLTAVVGVGMASIIALSSTLGLSDTTGTLAMMLGLAVGIDYALFVVSRYREEREKGRTPDEATALAVGTAGSAVVFAGLTVVIALAGLGVVGVPMLTEMGMAAAGAVVLAVVVALTLVPALLGFWANAVMARRDRRTRRDGQDGQGDRRTARLHGVIVLVAVTIVAVATEHTDVVTLLLQTVGPFCWLLLPLTAGDMTRLRRAYIQAVQARADHAERTREEEARLRVAEERMRIARELHDILAHHMALANAQAGTAAHLVLTHPEQTRTILTDLTGTTSAALRELKATLGLFRRDDPVPPAPPAGHTPSIPSAPKAEASLPLAPLPGLSRLPELVSVCASAGLDVVVTTDGERRPLLPGVDLTAYRIVQEALTNVTKHAATTTARVHLHYTDTRVWITITDDGPARPVTPLGDDTGKAGFGLTGMRERAASVGGELRADPRPEDGFEVTTVLPLGCPAPMPRKECPHDHQSAARR